MTEPTLSIDYDALNRNISELIGLDPTWANLTPAEQLVVDDIRASGLRQFYAPPVVDGGPAHQWSFFSPTTTLTTTASYTTGTITVASGVVTLVGGTFPSWAARGEVDVSGATYSVNTRDSDTQVTLDDTSAAIASAASYTLGRPTYSLPDDFGGIDGPLSYAPGIIERINPISITAEHLIREKRQLSNYFDRPTIAAVRPVTHDPTTGQRFEILFYPTPDDAYILEYRYRALANVLTSANKYPLGGPNHGETILESCLAVAERRLDDQEGVHMTAFMRHLSASIQLDKQLQAPESLGYNLDASDRIEDYHERIQNPGNYVSYEGQFYYD